MSVWIMGGAGGLAAYLLGAIPSGYLAGRWLKGVDIREHGSKSTGATNVLRTLGPWPALGVFLIDLLKGVAAILVMRALAADGQGWAPWLVCLAGLAAVLGHSRSVWLGFTGGKSAATGLGVLLAMSWPVGAGAAAAVVLVLAAFRIVSLASILGAATAIVLACALPEPLAYRLLVLAGGVYVIVLHRANIGRLLAGTEPRIGKVSLP